MQTESSSDPVNVCQACICYGEGSLSVLFSLGHYLILSQHPPPPLSSRASMCLCAHMRYVKVTTALSFCPSLWWDLAQFMFLFYFCT